MPVFTSPPDPIYIDTDDRCRLQLRHHPGRGAAVLLVHGASASSDTFRIGEKETLVAYLLHEGFDVWTLDWRAGMWCAQSIHCSNESGRKDPDVFTLDSAAVYDVPAAIKVMRAQGVTGSIGLVAHCMGGGIVAQGIAQRAITAADVENVVMTGLGLFYRAAIDDMLKAEDEVLEQLISDGQHLLHPILKWDPDVCTKAPEEGNWDRRLQVPYELWLDTPLAHDCADKFCHRISYMFGMPYLPANIPTIHPGHLPPKFGYIPLKFLLHCSQNLRRGHCGRFVVDRGGSTLPPDETYLDHAAFRDRKLTLITGDVNTLWHRDSIDTMYEWLLRGPRANQPRQVRKHVVKDFGHQDLYWGTDAPEKVFPLIRDGLRP